MEAWGWLVGKEVAVEAPPLHATQQWYLASVVTQRSASIAPSRKVRSASVASSENIPSCGTPYSYRFMLSFHSQQLSPPWIHFPSLSPCPHQETQDSGWGMQAAAQIMGTVLTLSCLSQASCCILTIPVSALADFPSVNGLFWVWEPLFTSVPLQGCWSLPVSSFCFFSFFHPIWLHGDSSCSFRCLIFC